MDALKNDLERENLWTYVKNKVKALVTDSAANMVGDKEGFVTLFKKEVGNPKIITQNCELEKIVKENNPQHKYFVLKVWHIDWKPDCCTILFTAFIT